jgi:hypothetical protein
VRPARELEPMRDDDCRAPGHDGLVTGSNLCFRGRIQRAGCFVEHQHGGIGEERPGQREALPFTS